MIFFERFETGSTEQINAADAVAVIPEGAVIEKNLNLKQLVVEEADISPSSSHNSIVRLPPLSGTDFVTINAEGAVFFTGANAPVTLVGANTTLTLSPLQSSTIDLPTLQASESITVIAEGAIVNTTPPISTTLVGDDAQPILSENSSSSVSIPPQQMGETIFVVTEQAALTAEQDTPTLIPDNVSVSVSTNQSSSVDNFTIDGFSAQLSLSSNDLQVSANWSGGETTYDWTLKNETTTNQIDSDLTFATDFNRFYGSLEHSASDGDTLRLRITDNVGNGETITERTTVVGV